MGKNKKGYSLIEVLAAFAIISIAILPIMSMYPAIFKQNRSASEIEEASRISMAIVDFIKARGYTQLINNNTVVGQQKYDPVGSIIPTNLTGNLYTLRRIGDINPAFITVRAGQDFALDRDLGFPGVSAAIEDAYVVLNAKGFDLSNTVIRVIMKRTDVTLRNIEDTAAEARYVDPVTDITTDIIYGGHRNGAGTVMDDFIVGRVIIGWGRERAATAIQTRQEIDRDLTGREKVYGINFVVTPIE